MNTNEALTESQRSIVTIAAYTANGNLSALDGALNEGLDAGLTINEIKEILVQLYAYAGFPRSLNAINTFERLLRERKQRGIKDLVGKEPSPITGSQSRFERGKAVQTILTGSTEVGAAQKFVPVIDTFLKEHLFADVFGRDNLDYKSREMATISALAALGGAESQLQSHVKVGRNIGLTESQLRGIAFVLATKVGRLQGNSATQSIDKVFHSKDIKP